MLIQETHQDVPTKADGKEGSMSISPQQVSRSQTRLTTPGIFIFHPTIPNYPNAWVVTQTEGIYQS